MPGINSSVIGNTISHAWFCNSLTHKRLFSITWAVLPNINCSFKPDHSNRTIMDTAASNASEATVRSKRHNKLPSHLDEYEVDYLPPVDPPPTASSRCHSQYKCQSRRTSHSKASSHSKSSGRFSVSGAHAASAGENPQRQYNNLLRQIEEDTLAEIECQRLQTQAKEAQHVQEEALMAKEALSNQLERRRKLKKAETDLEVAKLVNFLLSQDLSVDKADPEWSPDTTVSPPPWLHASLAQSPVPQQSPCPSFSMMQATQTIPEDQSTLRDSCIVQSTPKTPPLTFWGQYFTCLSAAQPSPVSMPVPRFNRVQPAVANLVTPRPDSALISQTVPPVAPIALTSHLKTSLPGGPVMVQTQPVPTTHQRVTLSSNIPICPQSYSPLLVPQAGYLPQSGTELLMAAAYGIPRPTLPVFESANLSCWNWP